MQLLLYSIVVEHLYGKKPLKVGIMFLRPNEKRFIEVKSEDTDAIKAEIKEIAHKINTDPPSITRSRHNAHKKLKQAQTDLQYAQKIGITIN